MTQTTLVKIYTWGLVAVMFGMFLHAPATVALGTIFPDAALEIKAWKELLLGVLLAIALYMLWVEKRWQEVLQSRVVQLCGVFSLLHLVSLVVMPTSADSAVAGLMIDLRFVLYFVLCFIAVRLWPASQRLLLIAAGAGASIMLGFGLLQITVLPDNILASIGYGKDTIAAYNTIDKNPDFVRISSTLRGPNPVGAVSVILLSAVAVFALTYWRKKPQLRPYMLLFAAASVAVLFASYSRSAYLAAAAALVVVGWAYWRKASWKWQALAGVGLAVALLASTLFQSSDWYKNVILHEDPESSTVIKSNDQHVESLENGLKRMIAQPFGAGVGSTGSASMIEANGPGVTIENYYLFVAHEVGWLGLLTYLAIFFMILQRLWQLKHQTWLALAIFSSGIGLSLVALLLPVWADDTTALVWWGLAGSIIGNRYVRTRSTRQQKAARAS